jgi:hypothetical protein
MKISNVLLLVVILLFVLVLVDRKIDVEEKKEKAARIDRVIDLVEPYLKPAPSSRFARFEAARERAYETNNADVFIRQWKGQRVGWWVCVDDVLEDASLLAVVPWDSPEAETGMLSMAPGHFDKRIPIGSIVYIRGRISSISSLGVVVRDARIVRAK